MTRIARSGVSVEIPVGWEADISGDAAQLLSDGTREPTVMHVASFPIPAERGSFGTEAVESMDDSDVFITLFEYGPESVGSALFASQGVPRAVAPSDFSRDALQRRMRGQTGLQHFFTQNGRAFCLYIVLGSHIDRADIIERVNSVLATFEIE